ncbi:MAG: tRNA (adenosine(37)-N6)-dimethylallyltransferase MiaA, partial [Kangiellaceae bacterium]|nr:tRNA (adenosine(37)-N6)-dimethylallyltransferase MiaA [Kangiellaceae bacterium]
AWASPSRMPRAIAEDMLSDERFSEGLRDGLADLPATDIDIRAKIKMQLEEKGLEFLHNELAKVDRITAGRLHVNDSQRITRALEVYRMTAKPLSQWHHEQKNRGLHNPLLSIALAPADRSILHKRIAQRFDQMLEDGLLDEVANLYNRGDLDLDCPSMRSVGYRQIWQYIQGELSLSGAKERAIIATRQLAKRQYTWLRSWDDAKWYDPTDPEALKACSQTIEGFINSHKF